MDCIGQDSLFIVILEPLFIGRARSLRISAELAEVGLKMYTGKIIGPAIIRDIGRVALSGAFAERAYSGVTSEAGVCSTTMRIISCFILTRILLLCLRDGYVIECRGVTPSFANYAVPDKGQACAC